MNILNSLLLALQIVILYKLITSSLWASERQSTECIKVIYSSIGLASLLTLIVAMVSMFGEVAEHVPVYVKASLFTLLTLNSLIAYHVVHIFDKRRINNRRGHDANRGRVGVNQAPH